MHTTVHVQNTAADALSPKVRQRLLAVLFVSPDRSFYANEIIALAQSGTGAVQRELASLVDAGLVSVCKQGNQRHYQADASAPIYAELRGLVLKTMDKLPHKHPAPLNSSPCAPPKPFHCTVRKSARLLCVTA